MQRLSADAIRAAGMKRKAPAEGMKRKTVAKKPRQAGISLGAPSSAARPTPDPAPTAAATPAPTPAPTAAERPSPSSGASARPVSPPATSGGSAPRPQGKGPAQGEPSSAEQSGGSSGAAGTSAALSGLPPRAPAVGTRPPGGRYYFQQEHGSEGWSARVRVGNEDSAFNDPVRAHQLCQLLLLPKDIGTIRGEPVDKMVEDFFPALVRMVHHGMNARAVVQKYSRRIAVWMANEKKLEAEKTAAEEKSKSAEASLKAAEERLEAAEERSRTAERERDEAVAREEALKYEVALKVAELRQAKADELEAAKKMDFAASQQQAAQQSALLAEARAGKAEADLKKVEADLQKAEERAAAAEARAEGAVGEYKASEAFRADVEFFAGDAYVLGYADCQGKVAGLFPELDLGQVALPAAEEAGTPAPDETEDDVEVVADDADDVIEVPPPSDPAV